APRPQHLFVAQRRRLDRCAADVNAEGGHWGDAAFIQPARLRAVSGCTGRARRTTRRIASLEARCPNQLCASSTWPLLASEQAKCGIPGSVVLIAASSSAPAPR